MTWHRLCLFSDVSQEKPQKHVVAGVDVLVVKSADDQVWAFQYFCSHADKPLINGKWDPATAQITCPFHRAVFALAEQGAVKAPPACLPLETYPVEIRNEGSNDFVYVQML